MKQNLLLTILAFLFSIQLFGQALITGIVADDNGDPLIGANIVEKGTTNGTITDIDGSFSIIVQDSLTARLVISFTGFSPQEVELIGQTNIDIALHITEMLDEVVVMGYAPTHRRSSSLTKRERKNQSALYSYAQGVDISNESYSHITSNKFKSVNSDPLSTFSIDVDKASYANVRRFINLGQEPPKDAVRIEEMINYFDYDYTHASQEHPITVVSEIAPCPWNKKHKLLHIGMKAKDVDTDHLPTSNLVFLIDVSGSMNSSNKLPLLQKSLRYLIQNLRATDRVAIVVYAGSSGVVLPPTSGDQKDIINRAIAELRAGGSTAGAEGIKLAYQLAAQYKNQHDNSRIVLATDGDFNVGINSDGDLQRLIEQKRKSGIYLTCLGFGMGNYKDSKLEILANKGNGNYAYIDNIQEARKTLGVEFAGTIFTIAKDVKIQIEFNPESISKYKLIGYENRLLNNEDFDNDEIDAGEIGLGHTVTALYELIPKKDKSSKNELRYFKRSAIDLGAKTDEVAFIKVRYKNINETDSKSFEIPVDASSHLENSENIKFSSAVALFGMLLRDNKDVKDQDYNDVLAIANSATKYDHSGYRREFIRLVSAVRDF